MVKKKAGPPEVKCKACNGTGFPPVIQPGKAWSQNLPAAVHRCGGKGRIVNPVDKKNETRRD